MDREALKTRLVPHEGAFTPWHAVEVEQAVRRVVDMIPDKHLVEFEIDMRRILDSRRHDSE